MLGELITLAVITSLIRDNLQTQLSMDSKSRLVFTQSDPDPVAQ